MVASPVSGFTHVSISVSDLEASLRFYCDVLGLPVLAEPFEGTAFDGREAMVLVGRSALCLQCHSGSAGSSFDPLQTGLDHIALQVGSLDELHAFADHLTTVGTDHSGVQPLAGFGHLIAVRDPDGILVELHALPR